MVEALTVVDRGTDSLRKLAANVAAEVLVQISDCIGDEVMKGFDIDSTNMQDALIAYLAECEVETESVAQVGLRVNDYRGQFGVALASVQITPANEDGEELLGRFDLESPTVGFIFPGENLSEVHFDTGNSGERLTALSGQVPAFDATHVKTPAATWETPVIAADMDEVPDSFEAAHKVGVVVPVLDQSVLDDSKLPNKAYESDLALPGTVYMCRYTFR
ncbi:hypothetical protein HOG48_06570 [Candidatus Peregrinibacteria bacterium]|jgi:hypothetical protein|nr:hypothetical protein [Candidatus Peregrinibacteria bacterium]